MQPGQTYARRTTPRVTIRTEGSSTVPAGATFKDKCASVRKAEQEPSVYKEEQEGERERNRETERQRDRERLM